LLAVGILGTQGCLTRGAVRMLTRCELERLEVHARSLDAPVAEIAWEGRCPGNQADDGPRIGPGRSGTFRIPMPEASCPRASVWASERVTTDRWVTVRGASASVGANACVVALRSDGRRILAIAPDGAGERTLAVSDVPQVTTNPLWWLTVPDALAFDVIVGGIAAAAWPLTVLAHGR
jgi:hypothetical protein